MNRKNRICALNLSDPPYAQVPDCPTRERLARAFAQLDTIQAVRDGRQDPAFGKSAENRIIWRELLELELQAVDEQIERISAGARDASA